MQNNQQRLQMSPVAVVSRSIDNENDNMNTTDNTLMAEQNARNHAVSQMNFLGGSEPLNATNQHEINAINHSGINAINHSGINAINHSGINTNSHSGINTNSHSGINTNSYNGINATNHNGINTNNHSGINAAHSVNDMFPQQHVTSDAYSPHTQYHQMMGYGSNHVYGAQPNTLQNGFAYTTPSVTMTHRSSGDLDYNNLTRSFSNQSDFNNRMGTMGSVDISEVNKKFMRRDSNVNQQQMSFDQQLNPVSQFYRSGSVSELGNNGNTMLLKNNSSRSSQNISYNPVASFYSSSHLNGTAILDEEEYPSAGFDVSAQAAHFNKNIFNRNNSHGGTLANYFSGMDSSGSFGASSKHNELTDGFEPSYTFTNPNKQQSHFSQNNYRPSFGQLSTTSSVDNYNSIPGGFAQGGAHSYIGADVPDFAPTTSAGNYGRSSFGSNYSSGNANIPQISAGLKGSNGFIPDFINNVGDIGAGSHSESKLGSPERKSAQINHGSSSIPPTSAYHSRKASTSSNGSGRYFGSNTALTSAPPVTKKKSNTNKSTNQNKEQSTLNCQGNNNIYGNSQQTPKMSKAVPKPTPNTQSVSSGSLGNNAIQFQIKPPAQQNAYVSRVQGNGLFFNQLLNKHEVGDDLQSLYDLVGHNYFSKDLVFRFVDDLKSKLNKEFINNLDCTSKLNKFVKYLISANDQFAGIDRLSDDVPFVTPQGKHLALVALKNGKLELLSVNKQFISSYHLKANNLIIIDGDRGSDLAVVVEPKLSFPLALLINFLKKKIHFDSLITDKANHYKNSMFISAILAQAKHVMGSEPLIDPINPKLYDMTELTQLIIPSKQVVKFASTSEVTTNLYGKFYEELKALKFATLKLNTLNKTSGNGPQPHLDIKILNSEYQFDKKKLTFYYVCEKRNDFRDLIKELFKFYKTRIWLCAIPNNLNIYKQHYFKKELSMIQGSSACENGVSPADEKDKPFDKVVLDNFQISVYSELLLQLF